ncbi:hypothetical protein NDU88_004317 [Pleurodeles waltl]|uniref:Uncharacterized protein n=1 Tax=Pleurodeles waltl TaxID=8319 RepID=A0AAV7MBC8_PLEWA|nr:hypothetical protein NDU88_004317 [Pleurodeles waltl]
MFEDAPVNALVFIDGSPSSDQKITTQMKDYRELRVDQGRLQGKRRHLRKDILLSGDITPIGLFNVLGQMVYLLFVPFIFFLGNVYELVDHVDGGHF